MQFSPLALAVALVTSAAGSAPAADAVFQYAIPVKPATGQSSTAFLWLPPDAKRVRGAVVAGMTLAERELVKDARVREACADEQIAVVFLKTGISSVDVQQVLDDLAKASGYRELSVARCSSSGTPRAVRRRRPRRWRSRTAASG